MSHRPGLGTCLPAVLGLSLFLAGAALFGVINLIMRVAPLGAFGAMAFTIGKYGLGSLIPLLKLILYSQVANGVLLPFVLIYMLLLINRKRIMQEYTNKAWQNVVGWSTAIVMVVLTAGLIWTQLS